MTTQYGPPLTGEQMKALRDAGLPDDGGFPPHLPADHIAYTLLEAGWLDGRNVRLWFGGDEAPDDWLEGSEVLWDNRGQGTATHGVKDPFHPWSHSNVAWYDIIAYIAKDEIIESDDPETVTIAKMTEAEARKRFDGHFHYVEVLQTLGLIKPEPTRAERFWQGKERNSLYRDESARALIDIALEFER